MPEKCCVPTCKSNYNNTNGYVSVFRFPKEQALRSMWIEKIPRKNLIVKKRTAVCEKHFNEEDIIRFDELPKNGITIKIPRKHPKLKPSAYPYLFLNEPASISDKKSTRRKNREEKPMLKKLLELAKQQAKEIEEVGSFESTKEGPVISSVSSIRCDKVGVEVNGEEVKDFDDSDDSCEKARQTSDIDAELSQNSNRYPTTNEGKKSATPTPKQTALYTTSANESPKNKLSPTSLNSTLFNDDRSPGLVLVDVSKFKFSPSNSPQNQLLLIKRSDEGNNSSTNQRLLLIPVNKEAASNTSKQGTSSHTTDSTFFIRQSLIDKQSEQVSRVDDPSEYVAPSSTHFIPHMSAHQQLFAKQEDAKASRDTAEECLTAAEERKVAAMEIKVAAEDKFLALEEMKIGVAERKVAAQERMAAAAERKVALLKRTLDYEVRLKRWKYF